MSIILNIFNGRINNSKSHRLEKQNEHALGVILHVVSNFVGDLYWKKWTRDSLGKRIEK